MGLLNLAYGVHLVGIGGSGMSAIARILYGRGFRVSGSDRQRSPVTDQLQAEGIDVAIGHRAQNLDQSVGLVVVSSAIPEANAEVGEARRRGLPVIKRDSLLAELTAGYQTVAVAGTHGKTTTSAMIAWLLNEAGLDPTFIVGGVLQNLGTNARAGRGPHFVVEADEYDRAFLGLSPDVAVVTIVEYDHPDCYPTFEDTREAFRQFAGRTVSGGRLIICGDDPEARRLGEEWAALHPTGKLITYGLENRCDWQAEDVRLAGNPLFSVRHGGQRLGTCALQLPGRHNVLNALAALAACAEIGVQPGTALAALMRFRGTARRFEVKGQASGVIVIDDYAHHPTEIRATLGAARTRYGDRPIWAVFQPHTFSRTAALLDDLAAAFADAEHVLVTDIYAAREQTTPGISGEVLASRISESGHPDARYVGTLEGSLQTLLDRVRPGDVVVTLGAGDGYLIGEWLIDRLRERDRAERAACSPSDSCRANGGWGTRWRSNH